MGAVRSLARTALFLHPRPVDIAVEPVGPELAAQGWPLATFADAVRLVRDVGQPNVRIVLDTGHLGDFTETEHLADNIGLVSLVQVADYRAPGGSWKDRVSAGEGTIDFTGLYRVVLVVREGRDRRYRVVDGDPHEAVALLRVVGDRPGPGRDRLGSTGHVAGVVDQDVNTAGGVDGSLGQVVDGRFLADVDAHPDRSTARRPDLPDNLLRVAEVDDDDGASFGGQA